MAICVTISGFAQPYKSYFGENYTKWYVYYPGHEYFYSEVYLSCCNRVETLDTFTYQCLFRLGNGQEDNVTIPQNLSSVAYFREDKNTGRLFFRLSDWTNEFIVSDMSLKIGDSVALYYQQFGFNLFDWQNIVIIDENSACAIVDSVFYLDDLKHIRTSAKFWKYEAGKYDTLKFVETIGSNFSPFLDLNPFSVIHSYSPVYTCYETENRLIHFPSSFNNSCFIYYVGAKEIEKYQEIREEIKNGILTLYFEQSFNGQIILFDYMGRMFYQKNLSNHTTHNIDVNKYQKGVYILSIRNGNNEFLNKKIVIF